MVRPWVRRFSGMPAVTSITTTWELPKLRALFEVQNLLPGSPSIHGRGGTCFRNARVSCDTLGTTDDDLEAT